VAREQGRRFRRVRDVFSDACICAQHQIALSPASSCRSRHSCTGACDRAS
jgi:hypothetical protein